MFIVRLHRLYTAIVLLVTKFGVALSGDFELAWSDIENAVATKSWSDIHSVISDAEQLYTDFLTTYTGSKDEVTAFLTALRELFTK